MFSHGQSSGRRPRLGARGQHIVSFFIRGLQFQQFQSVAALVPRQFDQSGKSRDFTVFGLRRLQHPVQSFFCPIGIAVSQQTELRVSDVIAQFLMCVFFHLGREPQGLRVLPELFVPQEQGHVGVRSDLWGEGGRVFFQYGNRLAPLVSNPQRVGHQSVFHRRRRFPRRVHLVHRSPRTPLKQRQKRNFRAWVRAWVRTLSGFGT